VYLSGCFYPTEGNLPIQTEAALRWFDGKQAKQCYGIDFPDMCLHFTLPCASDKIW
jgi:hypothetical protein